MCWQSLLSGICCNAVWHRLVCVTNNTWTLLVFVLYMLCTYFNITMLSQYCKSYVICTCWWKATLVKHLYRADMSFVNDTCTGPTCHLWMTHVSDISWHIMRFIYIFYKSRLFDINHFQKMHDKMIIIFCLTYIFHWDDLLIWIIFKQLIRSWL